MIGSPTITTRGHDQINLARIEKPTLFGNDSTTLLLDVEYHDESRLRLKVNKMCYIIVKGITLLIVAPPLC